VQTPEPHAAERDGHGNLSRAYDDLEALIAECEAGPREYNDWPYPATVAAARIALNALEAEADDASE
jgi:hypothetical protein